MRITGAMLFGHAMGNEEAKGFGKATVIVEAMGIEDAYIYMGIAGAMQIVDTMGNEEAKGLLGKPTVIEEANNRDWVYDVPLWII